MAQHHSIGSRVLRATYRYWFHTGEILAIRPMLDHTNLPKFTGDIQTEVLFRPD